MKIPDFPQHGTIFYTSGALKASAIFLNGELVITSGLILSDNETYVDVIEKSLKHCPVVSVCKSSGLKKLHELDFRVVRKHNNVLREEPARACHIVYSRRVKDCLQHILDGLHVCIDGDAKPVREYAACFASIVILSTNLCSVTTWEQIRKELVQLKPKHCESPQLLDRVITVSTPFGNESFLNTQHLGHITNILGEQDCVFLLDTHLSFGCEGGAVYNRNKIIQGILIGSTFMYRNENVSFPLAISIEEIFDITLNRRNLCRSPPMPLPVQAFRSVCLIDSQGCWGTGCAIELNGKHYIISCSHVLATDNITCIFNDEKIMTPKLIYKNPAFDSAYDIALMEATFDDIKPANWFCRLANYVPRIGQRLYAVGFPVFKSLAVGSSFKPSIIPGRATQYSEGILFTDCSIQSGQSGGPIFDENGLLVAIAVSNFKSSLDNRIYPFHNMCVPVGDIHDILVQYTQNSDKNSLERLQAEWEIKCKWKLKPPVILNKL